LGRLEIPFTNRLSQREKISMSDIEDIILIIGGLILLGGGINLATRKDIENSVTEEPPPTEPEPTEPEPTEQGLKGFAGGGEGILVNVMRREYA